ncbi:MAG: hypothetical protein ABII90_01315 [Bacteroidota bacterium]
MSEITAGVNPGISVYWNLRHTRKQGLFRIKMVGNRELSRTRLYASGGLSSKNKNPPVGG